MLYRFTYNAISNVLALIIPILISVAYTTLAERKTMASMQKRLGPNKVGPHGLLQAFADAIKLLLKEYVLPAQADIVIFFLGPIVNLTFSLLGYAMISYAPGLSISDFDLGILYMLAVSSLSTYGILLAGWSANSKYAFLGSIRSTAQLISYELILTSAILLVVLILGNLSLSVITESQKAVWSIFPLSPIFIMFFISSIAETNRPPFDLAEAESELVSGYMTEHAAAIFVFFFLGEYSSLVLICTLTAILFLGGYLMIFRPILFIIFMSGFVLYDMAYYKHLSYLLYYKIAILNAISDFLFSGFTLGLKTSILIFNFIGVRASYPRIRFDQLMSFCWTVLLPIIVGFILLIPCILYGLEMMPSNDILFNSFLVLALGSKKSLGKNVSRHRKHKITRVRLPKPRLPIATYINNAKINNMLYKNLKVNNKVLVKESFKQKLINLFSYKNIITMAFTGLFICILRYYVDCYGVTALSYLFTFIVPGLAAFIKLSIKEMLIEISVELPRKTSMETYQYMKFVKKTLAFIKKICLIQTMPMKMTNSGDIGQPYNINNRPLQATFSKSSGSMDTSLKPSESIPTTSTPSQVTATTSTPSQVTATSSTPSQVTATSSTALDVIGSNPIEGTLFRWIESNFTMSRLTQNQKIDLNNYIMKSDITDDDKSELYNMLSLKIEELRYDDKKVTNISVVMGCIADDIKDLHDTSVFKQKHIELIRKLSKHVYTSPECVGMVRNTGGIQGISWWKGLVPKESTSSEILKSLQNRTQ